MKIRVSVMVDPDTPDYGLAKDCEVEISDSEILKLARAIEAAQQSVQRTACTCATSNPELFREFGHAVDCPDRRR